MTVALSYNPTSFQLSATRIGRKLITVTIASLLLALGTAIPFADVIPEPITTTAGNATPDAIEDLLTIDKAAAWDWKKSARRTAAGAGAGGATGCGVGAVAGVVVASAPGCVSAGTLGAITGGIGGFFSSL